MARGDHNPGSPVERHAPVGSAFIANRHTLVGRTAEARRTGTVRPLNRAFWPSLLGGLSLVALTGCATLRGTGNLAVVIERATGSVQIIETSGNTSISRVTGLGDLSHASLVYSRDGRYAFIFGRDGGLSRVDLLTSQITHRVVQAGNSIGGAISQDGRLVAVANYEPGGVKIFSTSDLAPVADIPALGSNGKRSKVVGITDAPGQRFVFSLYDADEIWIADLHTPAAPLLTRLTNIGRQPYDGLITGDGRYYIAGLFGEEGLALLDLWQPDKGVRRILSGYGQGAEKLPVYKMPHLRGWAMAAGMAFLPAIGHHEVLVAETREWLEKAKIPVHGQPVFVMARPDGRQVWVNFAHPDNDTIQVIDVPTLSVVKTLVPGKGVMHMEFTPRGDAVWVSLRDADRIELYDTETFTRLAALSADKPSGIFMTARGNRIGF
ncbi:MAG: protein nirF [Magnetococcales bacterium]|nr:protein nirF [Magnetococcales bacterium]